MHLLLFPSKSWFFISITVMILAASTSVHANDGNISSCSARFSCGDLKNVGYPFWGLDRPESCGHPAFKLNCSGDNIPNIVINSATYRVLKIDSSSRDLEVARDDYLDNICPTYLINSTFNPTLFELNGNSQDINLYYGCRSMTGLVNLNTTITVTSVVNPNATITVTSVENPNATIPMTSVVNPNATIPPGIYVQIDCTINKPENIVGYFAIRNFPESSFEASAPTRSSFFGTCNNNVIIPVLSSEIQSLPKYPSSDNLTEALKVGFKLQWFANDSLCNSCEGSGGQCGHNFSTGEFRCYCSDGTFPDNCSTGSPVSGTRFFNSKRKIIIGGSVVAATIVVICIIWFIFTRHNRYRKLLHLRQQKTNANISVEAFVREYGTLAPKRYSYTEIKKMTNKFKEKLGQGGFGSVYKGKLPDGRLVAVKLLSQSKGNGEDFMNEVGSISRASHVNVVTLLGFCYNGSKRALVFEFMPHGSLDKFIYNEGSVTQSRLEWKLLYNIAFGVARGLEYLHQGCNTRILHFDIKPHNILLDESFCPKISDFGLSKLCERKESIVSMTGARGTIGFIAPEVFCRNFGGISYKSDVYSYGMMVLEMVGGRKNIDVGVSQTSEIYFPSWIYNHLDQAMNLKLDGVTTEEEEEIARKLIVVSLWCIQTKPSDRPSMTKVLEMLQGTLQALPVPPRPFVSSSPVRSPISTLQVQQEDNSPHVSC